MDLTSSTIKSLHRGLKEKQFSAVEVTQAYLKQVEKKDRELGAYLSTDKEGALSTAQRVDEVLARGEPISYLAGIPLAVKDNILIEGRSATAGSRILKDCISAYDATVIEKLKKENAVFLGKTNLDEFAMGSSTENSGYKITKNPYDLSRVPGGSSGGSAVAVAGRMAAGALGSDTGGSIRQPAGFCGVVGLKPTYGAVSRYGLIALASSLDQIGPLAQTVEDAAILFKAIAGHDKDDSTSVLGVSYEGLFEPGLEDLKKLTIGIPEEYFVEGLDNEVAESINKVKELLEGAGFKFKKISLPHTKYALSVYYIILTAEASTNLARYDGIRYGTRGGASNLLNLYEENRGEGFGPEVKRRIILGTFVLSAGYYDAYYSKAQRVRTLVKQDFEEAFRSVDVILAPTAPTPAFKIGERTTNPLEMYLSDALTLPVNLAGLPGISIPVKGREGKLPIGFQLIGKPFREVDILGVGRVYEGV